MTSLILRRETAGPSLTPFLAYDWTNDNPAEQPGFQHEGDSLADTEPPNEQTIHHDDDNLVIKLTRANHRASFHYKTGCEELPATDCWIPCENTGRTLNRNAFRWCAKLKLYFLHDEPGHLLIVYANLMYRGQTLQCGSLRSNVIQFKQANPA